MVSKQTKIIEEYLIVDLNDFLKMIGIKGDEKTFLEIQQVDDVTGSKGPLMKLSRRSKLQVMVSDTTKDDHMRKILESQDRVNSLTKTVRPDGTVILKGSDGNS